MTNEELIQRAERWLKWSPTQYAISHDTLFIWQGSATLLRECVAALKADTPPSTQRNPSPIDLPAPYWIAVYSIQLPGDVTDDGD